MKRSAKRNVTTILLGLAVGLGWDMVAARAQNPPPPKGTEPKCVDYNVDIPSLVDTFQEMYWKQDDCIRVHTTNNPFIFSYKLSFNEVLIKEDDPLGAIGEKFGLNVSGVKPTGDNSDNAEKDVAGKTAEQSEKSAELMAKMMGDAAALPATAKDPLNDALSKIMIASAYGDLNKEKSALDEAKELVTPSKPSKNDAIKQRQMAIKKAMGEPEMRDMANDLVQLEETVARVPHVPDGMDEASLKSDADAIGKTLRLITDEYQRFSREVPDRLDALRDPKTALDQIEKAAKQLRDAAEAELACLTAGKTDAANTTLLGCTATTPGTHAAAVQDPPLETRLVGFARKAQQLHAAAVAAQPKTTDTSDTAKSLRKLLDDIHRDGQDVAYDACADKALLDNDFASIRTGLIAPLDAVLNDGFSFGYVYPDVSVKREGPFGDPTGVTMTLKRDAVSPFTNSDDTSKLTIITSNFECSSDSEDLFTNGDTYHELADFFTDKPVRSAGTEGRVSKPNTYTRNQNNPKAVPDQKTADKKKKATASPASDDSDVVLVQPWFFGKARLVVTGGLSTGFLTKQEFQRSTSINSAGASDTVVGLKTNTKLRETPMLYGHALIPYFNRRHDSDAWYATLGVTANPDNKGTDPEFLVGISRSLKQQRFFVTAGAYIGERQKLDGGLTVGEVIPSTLTTDLPTTKSYRVGAAIGLSYRFTSTKDPQKNQPQTSGTTKTKKSN